MGRQTGVAMMLLTAIAVLFASIVIGNWLTGVAGGAFLMTGLASWKWPAGIKYAFDLGIATLLASIPFLFSKDSPTYYGTLGSLFSAAFLAGSLLTFRFDQRNKKVRSTPS
ncbi:hypothetical protein [Dehalogenimonas sp. 4OHTPN]|uniref:SPW repeat-containing protein n=1 Tax=Dehalogenimonas sp. 4OHTPN TaxID=3166643 RepID=A0AAU8G9V0_9CHLR